jgi:hypothetical protein
MPVSSESSGFRRMDSKKDRVPPHLADGKLWEITVPITCSQVPVLHSSLVHPLHLDGNTPNTATCVQSRWPQGPAPQQEHPHCLQLEVSMGQEARCPSPESLRTLSPSSHTSELASLSSARLCVTAHWYWVSLCLLHG